jgi:4-amino-4-deoxy-L-arabinose transferase-like glycosyltransferase
MWAIMRPTMPPDAALPVRGAALLLALTAALLLLRQGQVPLIGPDEPRYARVAVEMSRSGDLVTPTLQGEPWLEKPALYYWMAAAAFRAFGETETAARLPSIASALLLTGATALVGARLYGGAAGLHAGFALGTCLLVFIYGRAASMDMLLAATVTASVGLLALAALGIAGRLAIPAAFVFAALATLAKGPLGAILPALAAGGYILAARDWRFLRRLASPVGWALFVLVAAPWYILVIRAEGRAFLDTFLLEHNLQRFTSTIHRHPGPFVYYVPVLLAGLFPWSGLLVPALALVRPRTDRADLFVLSWLLLPLLFFSLAGSKLPGYVLPCLPPLALLIGRAADRMVKGGAVRGVRGAGLLIVILAALVVAVTIVAARAGEPAWPLLAPIAAWCVLMALLFSARIRDAPGYALRVLRVGAAGLLVLLTGAVPPILRARESGRDLFLPAHGREVLAWGAWRTAWMAGYFYNDGRVSPVAGLSAIQQRLAAGPVLVVCGPAERRILAEAPGLRARVLAEGPRGNALMRVEAAVLRVHPLHHLDHSAAPRRERVGHLVHELTHEEDPAAVGLQQVLFRQRIGDRGGIEPLPLVLDADLQGAHVRGQDDRDTLVLVPLVPVLDGVDDRLAHRDAEVMGGVLVEAGHLRRPGEDGLHHLEHVETAGDLELDGPQAGGLHQGKGAKW